MKLEFDPDKDRANVLMHGISLARAADLENIIVVSDLRFSSEQRYRLYGRIDGDRYCLAAVMRDEIVRAISLRRAHSKEFNRHVH